MSRVFQVKPKQVFEKVELKGHLLYPREHRSGNRFVVVKIYV